MPFVTLTAKRLVSCASRSCTVPWSQVADQGRDPGAGPWQRPASPIATPHGVCRIEAAHVDYSNHRRGERTNSDGSKFRALKPKLTYHRLTSAVSGPGGSNGIGLRASTTSPSSAASEISLISADPTPRRLRLGSTHTPRRNVVWHVLWGWRSTITHADATCSMTSWITGSPQGSRSKQTTGLSMVPPVGRSVGPGTGSPRVTGGGWLDAGGVILQFQQVSAAMSTPAVMSKVNNLFTLDS